MGITEHATGIILLMVVLMLVTAMLASVRANGLASTLTAVLDRLDEHEYDERIYAARLARWAHERAEERRNAAEERAAEELRRLRTAWILARIRAHGARMRRETT